MKVWLVIPAFCEGRRLRQVVGGAKKYISPARIVVVDDGSEPAERVSGCVLLRHQVNLGKGAAMKTGADFAFAHGAEAVIFMDSDLQHDPACLPQFIDYLRGGYQVVFGSRRPSLAAPLVRWLGNKMASVYMNILFGVYISDILSGYRALTRRAYFLLRWESSRYGVETEIVARLGRHHRQLKHVEFPIETVYIDKYKGVTIIDAIKILASSLWWKLS